MPELPEVETVRRGLQPVMEGATIVDIEQRRADLRFPFPERFVERLRGRTIVSVGRRAKYLIVHLDTGLVLVCHLGMSGSFRIESGATTSGESATTPGDFHHERSKAATHDHVVFHLARPDQSTARVVFNDPRRFGSMVLVEAGALEESAFMAALGVEPTGNELDGALLSALFRGKAAPLKAALLDQRLIAGLGNIYVSEALWRARLSPFRAAGSIASGPRGRSVRAERLAEAIRQVVAEAIAAGGSSLRDYVHADGSLGYFQHSFSVYDRADEPCPRERCRGVIRRTVQSGRSTFHCTVCQR